MLTLSRKSKIDILRQLSGCNWTRTHNYLAHKRTIDHLRTLDSTLKLAKVYVGLSLVAVT